MRSVLRDLITWTIKKLVGKAEFYKKYIIAKFLYYIILRHVDMGVLGKWTRASLVGAAIKGYFLVKKRNIVI